MITIENLWQQITEDASLIEAIFSNPRNKKETSYSQVRIKPILLQDQLHYHLEYVFPSKVTHENLHAEAFISRVMELSTIMKQMNIFTADRDYQVLLSKKMKVTILKKAPSKEASEVSLKHNRKKQYIFQEGVPVPFLIELGVMNKEGMVIKSKYNKFRQVNRFVEMVKDVTGELPKDKKIRIVDFGCGKSYLTFALHYYLKELCKLDIEVVGLDLKEDVITTCNRLVNKLGLEDLKFLIGDIEHFTEYDQVDMVVSLHACNTATDAALAKAVRWNAKVILAAPCCHHELASQIENDILSPILDYGILKERLATIATDAIRAQILEILGYKTQLVEFIDMEHTPKNLLIRGTKTGKAKNIDELVAKYKTLTSFMSLQPSLERMLEPELKEIIQ